MKRFHDSHLLSSAFHLSFFRLIPYTLILIPLFALPAFAQQTWERTYGGTNDDLGYSVQLTTDGGYIITGETWSFGAGYTDVYLIKTNASGDPLWTRTYGGTNHDWGNSVQQTSDGGYIIAGQTLSFGAGNWDVWLIKTNASGDTLWTRTYGGPDADKGNSVQQTTDGGYIVAGFTMVLPLPKSTSSRRMPPGIPSGPGPTEGRAVKWATQSSRLRTEVTSSRDIPILSGTATRSTSSRRIVWGEVQGWRKRQGLGIRG
jgi:hypothetical protein